MKEVDNYIAKFPKDVQQLLKKVRACIKITAPEAIESIAYMMPAYKLNGKPLVYFAAYKHHIGFYATPSGHSKFSKELAKYKQGKGSVQFPLDKPIPFDLIEKIVTFKANETINKKEKQTPKKQDEPQVDVFLKKLNHPLNQVVNALRLLVLETDKEISEQIKWNSPSFYYSGKIKAFDPKEYKRDLVVFNLHKKDLVLLVFPTGSIINDKSGLLSGNFSDTRKVAKFSSLDDVKSRKKDLQNIIRDWLKKIDK